MKNSKLLLVIVTLGIVSGSVTGRAQSNPVSDPNYRSQNVLILNTEAIAPGVHQAKGQFVFESGIRDSQDNFLGGTEVRDLVGFQGKLYAGLGQWMDLPTNGDPAMPAEIIVLDRPNGSWRREAWFPEKISNGRYFQYTAVSGLYKLMLTPQLETLGACFWVASRCATVMLRHPQTGQWVDTGFGDQFCRFMGRQGVVRPYLPETRVVQSYKDSVTGKLYLFVAANLPGGKAAPGYVWSDAIDHVPVGATIWKGIYDPNSTNLVQWEDQPEANFNGGDLPLAARLIMLYDDAGVLYCGAHVQYKGAIKGVQSGFLARRVDGPNPHWKVEIFPDLSHNLQPRSLISIRGMIRLQQPPISSPQYVLSGEGNGRIYRYEPQNKQVTLEWDAVEWFREATGYRGQRDRILWYRSSEYQNPKIRNGEQIIVAGGYFAGYWNAPNTDPPGVLTAGYYGYRTADGVWYLGELIDPTRHPMPALNGTHNFAVSPFTEDKGLYLYVGFFGCDVRKHVHNTARIMRVSAQELFQNAHPEN